MSEQTRKPEVLAMVKEQLQRRCPPSTAALYGRAVRIDASIRKLTVRQFNAKYPLPVKREMARERAKKQKTPRPSCDGCRKSSVDRQAIEEVLVRFAREVVAAQGTAGVIDPMTRVDGYVEEVLAASAS